LSKHEYLFGTACCAEPPTFNGLDPLCGYVDTFATVIAAGMAWDRDNDFVPDFEDSCPAVPNDQADRDWDGVGDACDNCPDVPNADQTDVNHNGVGDACELLDAGTDGD